MLSNMATINSYFPSGSGGQWDLGLLHWAYPSVPGASWRWPNEAAVQTAHEQWDGSLRMWLLGRRVQDLLRMSSMTSSRVTWQVTWWSCDYYNYGTNHPECHVKSYATRITSPSGYCVCMCVPLCRVGWSVWGVRIDHVMTWPAIPMLARPSSLPKRTSQNQYPSHVTLNYTSQTTNHLGV